MRRRGAGLINSTAAFAALFTQEGVDYGGGTAHAAVYGNGTGRTVAAACSAFHAGVAVPDKDVVAVFLKNIMRANFHAHTAADAFLNIELQSYDIF